MKTTRLVSLSVLLATLEMANGIAAPASTDKVPIEDSLSMQQDPDGVPLSVTDPKTKRAPTPEEIQAQRKADEKAAEDRDWFMRAYADLERRRKAQSSSEEKSYFDQISSDPQMAKLAGVPYIDRSEEEQKAALRAASPSAKISLRPDPSTVSSPISAMSFPSMVPPPLPGSTSSNGQAPLMKGENWQAKSTPPATSPAAPSKPVSSLNDPNREPLVLDVPGRLAAESNKALNPNSSTLSFDLISDEPPPPTDMVKPEPVALALPIKAAPRAQAVTGVITTEKVITPKLLPPEPKPFTLPPPNPVRRAIPDPFDIYTPR